MAVEDFTTFTEVDGGADITVTSTKCDVVLMRNDEDSSVYKDYTASHFDDFDHDIETTVTAVSTAQFLYGGIWNVANTSASTLQDINDNNDGYWCAWRTPDTAENVGIRFENEISDNNDTSIVLSKSTKYYLTIERTATTLKTFIYDDSGRTSLVDTLTITREGTTFRYLAGCCSRDSTTNSARITYSTENLDLQESSVVNVTPTPSALTLTGAVLSLTPDIAIESPEGAMILSVLAPTVNIDATSSPSALASTLSVEIPSVVTTGNITPTPSALVLTGALLATIPEVDLAPSALAVTSAVLSPTVDISGDITLSPNALALTSSVLAPTLDVTVLPSALAVSVSVLAPSIAIVYQASAQALSGSVLSPSISVGGSKTVTPSTIAISASLETPDIYITIISSTVSATASATSPTITIDSSISVSALALALSLVAPLLSGTKEKVLATKIEKNRMAVKIEGKGFNTKHEVKRDSKKHSSNKFHTENFIR